MAEAQNVEGAIPGLAGKTAIVWGGGAGMGLATANRLAASGCRLALADIDGAQAEQSALAMRARGIEAIGLRADITLEEDVAAVVASARAELGTPQLSASVVGMASWKPVLEMSLADWDKDQKLNILPVFLIGREMARLLSAEELPGNLVFVASVSGLQAAHSHASYGAAKCAMTGLVQSLAAEWGGLGIRVNAVAPGAVHTQRIQPSEQMNALFQQRVPAGRMAHVAEMASCLAFLLSDLASYVTGHTLIADGGWMTVPAIMPGDNPKLPAAGRE